MASRNENPVHLAVRALEEAMRTGHQHRRRIAEQAYAGKAAPPVAARPLLPEGDQTGGAA